MNMDIAVDKMVEEINTKKKYRLREALGLVMVKKR